MRHLLTHTAGFVTDVVEDELAHVMENLGVAPDVMRRRVEDVLLRVRLRECIEGELKGDVA